MPPLCAAAPAPELHMSSVPEYNLRDLGPWDPEGAGLWSARDPLNPSYLAMVWWQETGLYPGQYLDANAQPIYFAGTDPRHPGHPPPEVENDMGTPREQWERVNGPLEE